jgi:hypothetical protein
MRGLPRVVPPNPWGWCAHGCRFEMDGEHYQFFAYYYEDPVGHYWHRSVQDGCGKAAVVRGTSRWDR